MAYEETLVTQSYKAASDFSDNQYRLVEISADDTVDLADSSTADIIGVNQGTPDSGEAAAVAISGVTKVVAGESLSAGNLVTSGSDAKAEKAETGSSDDIEDNTRILGKVVNGADSDGYASVLIDKQLTG